MADSATTPEEPVVMDGDVIVEFNEASSRQQINSGESVKTLFGKIRKFLTDLKAVAFSGSYDDLSNTPDLTRYASKSKYGDTTINVGRKADTVIGAYSTAEGRNATASGTYSHAEGNTTTASNAYCHAEGYSATASGESSHAEGYNTTASEQYSHAEGCRTTASGNSSHAEGYSTTASGSYSHTEGLNTTASGSASHAGGIGTKALHDNEVAYGKYNESKDDTIFSVGDGTADDARHNAFEITTTGGKLHDKDIAVKDDIVDINTMIYTVAFDGVTWEQSGLGKFYYPINLNNVNKIISVSLGDFNNFSPDEIVQPIVLLDQQIGIISNVAKSNGKAEIHVAYI